MCPCVPFPPCSPSVLLLNITQHYTGDIFLIVYTRATCSTPFQIYEAFLCCSCGGYVMDKLAIKTVGMECVSLLHS